MSELRKTRIVAFVIFFISALSVRGNTYYFSSASGDDTRSTAQAQNPSTPWKTLAKLNSFFGQLKPGDSVLLQRGSVFTGQLVVSQSGISTDPIVISSYGTGAAPVINGFVTLTGWTTSGGSIWQSPCTGCGARVNIVDVADSSQPMGRYPNRNAPNGGYAIVQSHTDSTSLTDVNLASASNWTGADVVIRKNRYIIERDSILLHSGSTLKVKQRSNMAITNRFGYFIQNSLKTLDQNGEWYYDPVAHKMNMYWTASPASISIKASMIDTLIKVNKSQYVVINGLQIVGANSEGIYLFQSNYITVSNCSIRFAGLTAVQGIQSNNLTFQSDSLEYANNNSFDLDGSRSLIQDCSVLHTAIFPGMGNPASSYTGIMIHGDNNTVQYNKVDSTGYCPILFVGSSNAVKYNFVNYFAFVKDDGGGIYGWSGDIDSSTRRIGGWIQYNIVLNGITVPGGTDSTVAGIAHGIYLDENMQTANISYNTVASCTAGIFIQDSHELTVQNNTFFNNNGQIIFRHNQTVGTLKNNDVSGNTAVSLTATQNNVVVSSISPITGPPALTAFGYLHNNKYAQLSNNSLFYLMAMQGLNATGTFGQWQSSYGLDYNSTKLATNFAPYTINQLIGSNLYTKGSIITPFTSAVTGTRVIVSTPIGNVDSGKTFVSHFTLHAPDNNHTLLVFLQQYPSPYTHLTTVMNVFSATPSCNNTVVFNTTGSNTNSSIVFQMNQSDPRIYIDNIDLYLANVTVNSPDSNYVFQYNASKTTRVVALSGSYQDAGGTVYSGSLTLQPYSSVVLFKK
jgi:parallel beta-helix repeat protein